MNLNQEKTRKLGMEYCYVKPVKGFPTIDECFKTDDLSKDHICGGCAVKSGKNCSNLEIQNFLSKKDQTQEEKTAFVFDLAVRSP